MSEQEYLLAQFARQRVKLARARNYEQAYKLLVDLEDSNCVGESIGSEVSEYLTECAARMLSEGISLEEAFNIKQQRGRPKKNPIERDLKLALTVYLQVQDGNGTNKAIDTVTGVSTSGRKAVEAAYYRHRDHVRVLCSLGDIGWRALPHIKP